MSYPIRRAFVLTTVVLVLGCIVSACSGTSGQAESAAIGVKVVTSPFVTVEVENRAGRPLLEMDVTLKTGSLLYAFRIPRLETNGKRAVLLSDFRGTRDGGVINPNLVRLTEVVVTARDLDGKKYEVSAPWKQ